jgi:predicted transcriptional regulator
MTQQQIAEILHVGRGAVQKYLDGLLPSNKPPRPKGGRPKAPAKRKYTKELEDQAAKLVLDEGVGVVKTAAKLGVSEQVVIRSTERERGRREQKAAEPVFTRKDLSVTAQQKYDIAVRQYLKKLDSEFEDRVKAEHLRREDIWLGWELEEFRKAAQRNYNYPGFMTKAQYRDLQRCLHTDTLDGIAKQGTIDPATRKRFDDILGLVIKLEAVLVKEDRKAPPRPTMEELMRRRAEVFAKRSAQSKANAAKRKPANGAAVA